MTDYAELLHSIRVLQPSKLSYIELLQEEVKRNPDVSDDRHSTFSSSYISSLCVRVWGLGIAWWLEGLSADQQVAGLNPHVSNWMKVNPMKSVLTEVLKCMLY